MTSILPHGVGTWDFLAPLMRSWLSTQNNSNGNGSPCCQQHTFLRVHLLAPIRAAPSWAADSSAVNAPICFGSLCPETTDCWKMNN